MWHLLPPRSGGGKFLCASLCCLLLLEAGPTACSSTPSHHFSHPIPEIVQGLSPMHLPVVFGPPSTSENRNSSWRCGIETRSHPMSGFTSSSHMRRLLYRPHFPLAMHGSGLCLLWLPVLREKKLYIQDITLMVNLKQFFFFFRTDVESRHHCISSLKCMRSLDNHKKKSEEGHENYFS